MTTDELAAIGNLFEILADLDFRGASPVYERLARDAAEDGDVLSLLLSAAPNDRTPHLLFAAAQYLIGGEGRSFLEAFEDREYAVFREWLLDHRSAVEEIVASRVIQTNEVGRCSALAPTLAAIARWTRKPLALVEVGASGGLNLLFDRYRYAYGPGFEVGPESSDVVLRPRMDGDLTPPLVLPEVIWRRGLDRQPVDVMDDDAVAWLRACIWPEQHWRTELLTKAVATARRDPPTIIAGDVYEALPELARAAPDGAALCVAHTAVAGYLPDRPRFRDLLGELAAARPLWWVSGEGPGLVADLPVPPTTREGIYFLYGVVSLGRDHRNPVVLARAGAHGAWLEWLDGESR